jgi:hypothetical protein
VSEYAGLDVKKRVSTTSAVAPETVEKPGDADILAHTIRYSNRSPLLDITHKESSSIGRNPYTYPVSD